MGANPDGHRRGWFETAALVGDIDFHDAGDLAGVGLQPGRAGAIPGGINRDLAPVRGVRWPWAVLGGAFAGVLWHQAKVLFNWYLVHYARYNLFYGILGGFVGLAF
jgi:hypothetical protein